MSYDLVIFDLNKAPYEKNAFLKWYGQQSEDSYNSSELVGQELEHFFVQLRAEFPPMNGPHANDDIDNPKLTDYSFGPYSIYMCFAWSQATLARQAVAKYAKLNSVGFYDISDPNDFVWWPCPPGQFGVFYCFYGNNEVVKSDLPLPLNLKDIVSQLLPKLVTDTDYLGIVDSDGETVQFMYHEADNRFWMEIPVPEKRGSYGTYLSRAELQERVESLPIKFSLSEFPELRFQSWGV